MDFNPDTWMYSRRFDSLYQYFSRKYRLERIELEFAELVIPFFYISDVDRLLDELIALGPDNEAVTDERLPYWAELWPSAIALSRFIADRPDLIRGKHLLDLGCGTGLTGILASLLGAEVTITDYQQEALKLAEMNWLLNVKRPPRCLLMDWRNPPAGVVFDTILASDVVYEERFFQPLVNIIERNLDREGKVILSEPNRTIARGFFEMLERHHFGYEKTDWEFDFKDKLQNISVYLIFRSIS